MSPPTGLLPASDASFFYRHCARNRAIHVAPNGAFSASDASLCYRHCARNRAIHVAPNGAFSASDASFFYRHCARNRAPNISLSELSVRSVYMSVDRRHIKNPSSMRSDMSVKASIFNQPVLFIFCKTSSFSSDSDPSTTSAAPKRLSSACSGTAMVIILAAFAAIRP